MIVDIEFAAPQATANAARKGLNVIAICVGDMSKAFIRELENEKIKKRIMFMETAETMVGSAKNKKNKRKVRK